MPRALFHIKSFCTTKTFLSFIFLLFVALSSPSVGLAAGDWQLQKESWSGTWQSMNQLADKLSCARAAEDEVKSGRVYTGSIRCSNTVIGETLNWPALQRIIDEDEAARAASSTTNPPPTPGKQCSVETPSLGWFGYWGTNPSLLPCGPNGVDCLECGLCGFLMLGQRISYVILSFLVFIIAPIRFIWGGFQILISRGSAESVSKGKKTIYFTVVGLIIAMGAFLIVQTFLWLLGGTGITSSGKVAWPQISCQRNINPYPPATP